jgi:hypothetical protein
MKKTRARLILTQIFCALAFLTNSVSSCKTGADETSNKRVNISPRLTESQIRAQVLANTPIGSPAQDVLTFAHTRLHHARKEMDYYDRQNHAIMILLGTYGLGRETYVTWKFDAQDKLVEVYVEKYRDFL